MVILNQNFIIYITFSYLLVSVQRTAQTSFNLKFSSRLEQWWMVPKSKVMTVAAIIKVAFWNWLLQEKFKYLWNQVYLARKIKHAVTTWIMYTFLMVWESQLFWKEKKSRNEAEVVQCPFKWTLHSSNFLLYFVKLTAKDVNKGNRRCLIALMLVPGLVQWQNMSILAYRRPILSFIKGRQMFQHWSYQMRATL